MAKVKPQTRPQAISAVSDVTKAVTKSSRYVNDSTCLVRALTCQIMLARRGVPSDLKIGVAFNSAKALEGHAWVEFDNKVIIGNMRDLDRYTTMPLSDFTSIRP